jgi:hypothetical protein
VARSEAVVGLLAALALAACTDSLSGRKPDGDAGAGGATADLGFGGTPMVDIGTGGAPVADAQVGPPPGDAAVTPPPGDASVKPDGSNVRPTDALPTDDAAVVNPPDPDAAVVDPPDPDAAVVNPPDPDAAIVNPPDAVFVGDAVVVNPPDPDAVPAGDAVVVNPPDPDAVVGDAAIVNPPDPDAAVVDPPDPPPVDPAGAGPLGSRAAQVRLELPGGGIFPRRVDVFVHRPNDPAGAPYPLIVLSHGFQLAGDDYTSYAERWASHGFVVVAATYDGGLSTRTHAELAEDFVSMVDWTLAQNADPGADLFHWVDPEHIGAAGHSRGGKQSFFGALVDARVDAVFGLDPVDSGPPFGGNARDYPSLAPERMGELHIPIAVVGSERGPQGAVPCAPGDDNWDEYYNAANSPAYAWLIAGSGHMDFQDACGLACLACTGGDDPGFTREFSRTTSTAFFRYFLYGEAAYGPWLDGPAALADARVEVLAK